MFSLGDIFFLGCYLFFIVGVIFFRWVFYLFVSCFFFFFRCYCSHRLTFSTRRCYLLVRSYVFRRHHFPSVLSLFVVVLPFSLLSFIRRVIFYPSHVFSQALYIFPVLSFFRHISFSVRCYLFRHPPHGV